MDTTAVTQPVDLSLAHVPNDAAAVPELVRQINTEAKAFLESESEAARHALILKARTLMQALETPRETMIKHCWAQSGALGALNFGVECGLWKLMARNGDGPQKVGNLASALGVDPALLGRLMLHLGAMGYIRETDVDEYKPTNYSKAMSIDMIAHGYPAVLTCSSAAAIQFHEWARENEWKTPTDAGNTSFHRAYSTQLNFFEWQHHRGYGVHSNNHMSGSRQGRLPWMDTRFFPVAERLLAGAKTIPESVLLVDVGGSVGHDIEDFHRHFPDCHGRLMLQDVAEVIAQVPTTLPAKIERMVHDFTTEQPVRGARAYYMHSCLHDWPDSTAAQILTQIKSAMEPGYSKILIHENVIAVREAYWEQTALDIVLLTCFSSRERTESDWRRVVEEMAGLKIVKIWSGDVGVESLIEVEFQTVVVG